MSSSPSPGPTRCTPAACTRPAAARRRASPLPHGHQANASGGSSSASGVSSSGSAGSQPATTTVGRGGPIGRTATCAPCFSPPTIRPPAAPKPSRAARIRVQWQRDERVAHGGQRDPGTGRADRRDRPGQHRIAGFTGAEQLLDRHAERPGQAQGNPQRGIGMAGLDGGHRLPGDAGHAGQLLLGQAARLPGQPQPRPVRLGYLRHVPTSPSRVICSLPYGASQSRLRSLTARAGVRDPCGRSARTTRPGRARRRGRPGCPGSAAARAATARRR